ncbi:hypothetical protein PROFUN_02452 [Planoprotostelium fungivorum]|uniref:Uncharacterized protein n=1 Tax=Planoprotostelium fungivorum TaxID=1890364 RepID=A0A2P6NUW1_9EUKA|nr:hypothetical protein PROFUN_02452 [Planoprotostelium fungivorum]
MPETAVSCHPLKYITQQNFRDVLAGVVSRYTVHGLDSTSLDSENKRNVNGLKRGKDECLNN